jgi:hypothetical protein
MHSCCHTLKNVAQLKPRLNTQDVSIRFDN